MDKFFAKKVLKGFKNDLYARKARLPKPYRVQDWENFNQAEWKLLQMRDYQPVKNLIKAEIDNIFLTGLLCSAIGAVAWFVTESVLIGGATFCGFSVAGVTAYLVSELKLIADNKREYKKYQKTFAKEIECYENSVVQEV